MEDTKHANGHV